MIKINLRIVMAERKLNISELSRATGISRNTISGLYHETAKGIQFDTLDKLCEFLNVTPGQLIVHSSGYRKGKYTLNGTFLIECSNCGMAFPVLLENDRIPGCVRCPRCGQRTCGE